MDLGGAGSTFLRNVETVASKGRNSGDDNDLFSADLPPAPTDIVVKKTLSTVLEAEPLATKAPEQMRVQAASQTGATQADGPQASTPIQTRVQPNSPLIPQDLLPTDAKVMMISLCEVIARWNHRMPNGFCCVFHANLKMASQICNTLINKPCTPQVFDSVLGEQCQRCGLLGLDHPADECEVCKGVEVRVRRTTAQGVQRGLTSL
mmetsp:Transcript_43328/g.125052  ORF Transcript_43328/g.125052 Transcript_43328/m.125052 type:complete len:206 (+) Transcript_43328:1-618(+)